MKEIEEVANIRGVCNFLSSVSSQQKLEVTDQHYSLRTGQCYNSWTGLCHSSRMDQYYSSVLQLSFSWQAKENASLRCEDRPTQKTQREDRGPDPKQGKERGPWLNFGSSFYMFFSPPPEPALCKLG